MVVSFLGGIKSHNITVLAIIKRRSIPCMQGRQFGVSIDVNCVVGVHIRMPEVWYGQEVSSGKQSISGDIT